MFFDFSGSFFCEKILLSSSKVVYVLVIFIVKNFFFSILYASVWIIHVKLEVFRAKYFYENLPQAPYEN